MESSATTVSVVTQKIVRKTKKLRQLSKSEDFYRLAALLANPDINNSEEICQQKMFESGDQPLESSQFLEMSFQEKSPLYLADHLKAADPTLRNNHLLLLAEKWAKAFFCEPPSMGIDTLDHSVVDDVSQLFNANSYMVIDNAIKFSPREQALLLAMSSLAHLTENERTPMSPVEFHRVMSRYFSALHHSPLLLVGQENDTRTALVFDKARLFSSHRMSLKSLQKTLGADPTIRYFHVAFLNTASGKSADVVYWLAFDENHEAHYGQFVEGLNDNFFPNSLWSSVKLIDRLNNDLDSFPKEDRQFYQSIWQLSKTKDA